VIPVGESIEAHQWVLPTEQVLEIIRNARSLALQNCVCRSHYHRCDNPWEVCLLLNDYGDKFVAQGLARHISFDKAIEVLQNANERGLIHLSLYRPDHELYALCSCCPCCCHDLQIMKLYKRNDIMVHSEYVAITDMEACIHCGQCIERCIFDARKWEDNQMVYNAELCYGCGLCVTPCPMDAIVMQRENL
jgi:Pyruvate/2-oxoacid:ferredoxin oxidoreductase delta subunit